MPLPYPTAYQKSSLHLLQASNIVYKRTTLDLRVQRQSVFVPQEKNRGFDCKISQQTTHVTLIFYNKLLLQVEIKLRSIKLNQTR